MEEEKFFIISGAIAILIIGFGFGIMFKSLYDQPRSQENVEACESHCEEIDMAMVGVNLTSTGYVHECSCGLTE